MSVTRRLVFAAAVLCSAGRLAAQPGAAAIDVFLRDSVRLNDRQRSDLDAGKPVAVLLPTALSRDVTVLGVVRLPVSRSAYATRLRDDRSLIGTRRQRYGVFATPPVLANVREVASDASEYRKLEECRAGQCKFKLPESAMALFKAQVDWRSPDAKAQVDSIARTMLLGLASRYRLLGNAAMVRYDDNNGVEGREALAALLVQPPALPEFPVALRSYVTSFPARMPDATRDILYWSEDRLPRLSPTLTMTHMMISTPAHGPLVVVRKQVYANHFFEAALEYLVAYEAPTDGNADAMYVVTLRRYARPTGRVRPRRVA